MDVREKLWRFVKEAIHSWESDVNMSDHITNNLIAHGVTAQEWISVKDRLPEKNSYVLVATDTGNVFGCLYAYDGWDLWEGNEVNITHWQPMPQPPKGE